MSVFRPAEARHLKKTNAWCSFLGFSFLNDISYNIHMHKSFNKIFLLLIVFLLAVPFFALADSYDGPFCFETPSAYDTPDTSGIRGTCREVETTTVVSLDPALQKDYFLGTHSPIEYNCDLDGCMGSTINSESVFLTNSSTLKMPTLGVE